MGSSEGKGRLLVITPTLTTSAYADGDQMGGVLTLTSAVDATADTATLISVQVVDKAKQSAPFDILFFNASPTLASTDNAALSVSDTEMVQKFIGRVSVDSADYSDTAQSSDATVLGVGLYLQAAAGSSDLYAVLQCRGTPTYGAAADLVVKLGILQD